MIGGGGFVATINDKPQNDEVRHTKVMKRKLLPFKLRKHIVETTPIFRTKKLLLCVYAEHGITHVK